MDAFDSIHPVPAAWLRDSDLAPFVPVYVRRLVERHYAASTVRMYVYCVAHFARWARRHHVDLSTSPPDVVQRFVDEHLPRCTCQPPVQRSRHQVRAALSQLLSTLVDGGVLISNHRPDAIEDQLKRFDAHIGDHRRAGGGRRPWPDIVRPAAWQRSKTALVAVMEGHRLRGTAIVAREP